MKRLMNFTTNKYLFGSNVSSWPRPERPEYYKEFRKYIQGFEQRLLVVPGLTGWAQINGGYNILPDQKAELDVEYIENRSFWNDLKIIFRTVKIVLTHDGAR